MAVLGSVLLLSLQALLCTGAKFWHISDLHLDFLYVAGGNTSDMCHAPRPNSTQPGDGAGVAGEYACDAPLVLVESALLAMQRLEPKPDWIVWTGDSAPHWRDPAPPDQQYIAKTTKLVFQRLDTLFPGVPIVPALGNHDASPPDQFPVTADQQSQQFYDDLWTSGAFGDHIDPEDHESMETFKKCGYYTKSLNRSSGPRLKFVVLNTNIYYHDDQSAGPDPCGQLAWLNATLVATPATEKVYLVAHVPPGTYERDPGLNNWNSPSDTVADITRRFLQIVRDPVLARKVVVHLYGHLHTDTFRLLLDQAREQEVRGVAFMAGSVTPILWTNHTIEGVNPTIRLLETEDNTGTVTDYQEFSLDITRVNLVLTASTAGDSEQEIDLNERGEEAATTARSRRKNGKFLKEQEIEKKEEQEQQNEELDNSRSRREVTDAPMLSTTTAEVTTLHTSETSSVTQFTTLEAVPSTESDANKSIIASFNKSSEDPTVYGEQLADRNDQLNKELLSKQWKLLYRASDSLNVSDIRPASLFSAYQAMVAGGPGSPAFRSYYEHNTGGHVTAECGQTCWRGHLCSITRLGTQELQQCLASTGTQGFYYRSGSSKQSNSAVLTPHQAVTLTPHQPQTTLAGQAGRGSEAEEPDLAGEQSGTLAPHGEQQPVAPSQDVNHALNWPEEEVDAGEGVKRKQLVDRGVTSASNALAIFFGLAVVVAVLAAAAFGYKKYRDNRYRNQEFLLTDSVFRYDGYSQLDDA